jgi:predicted  nucleic acid-binding Zn-ribbon protein
VTHACERCGSRWPSHLMRLVPLEGCPECCPEAWRSLGSNENERLRAPSEQSRRH